MAGSLVVRIGGKTCGEKIILYDIMWRVEKLRVVESIKSERQQQTTRCIITFSSLYLP
jgi:hypothetical protein